MKNEGLLRKTVQTENICPCQVICLLMQGASNRLFVDVILQAAVLITASLLKLGRGELAIAPGVNIVGKVAQGCMGYLITFQGLQVRRMTHEYCKRIVWCLRQCEAKWLRCIGGCDH